MQTNKLATASTFDATPYKQNPPSFHQEISNQQFEFFGRLDSTEPRLFLFFARKLSMQTVHSNRIRGELCYSKFRRILSDVKLDMYRPSPHAAHGLFDGFRERGVRVDHLCDVLRQKLRRASKKHLVDKLRGFCPHNVHAQDLLGLRIAEHLDEPVSLLHGHRLAGAPIREARFGERDLLFRGLPLGKTEARPPAARSTWRWGWTAGPAAGAGTCLPCAQWRSPLP